MFTNKDLNDLKKIAKMSQPSDGNNIGAMLICEDGKKYSGFTIKRSTVLQSTCAERMALDKWYCDQERTKIKKMMVIGLIRRPGWNESHVCLPCGVCRELYHQLLTDEERLNFKFECYSWNQKNKIVKTMKELLFYDKPFYK